MMAYLASLPLDVQCVFGAMIGTPIGVVAGTLLADWLFERAERKRRERL